MIFLHGCYEQVLFLNLCVVLCLAVGAKFSFARNRFPNSRQRVCCLCVCVYCLGVWVVLWYVLCRFVACVCVLFCGVCVLFCDVCVYVCCFVMCVCVCCCLCVRDIFIYVWLCCV